jgi:hypothetical protein
MDISFPLRQIMSLTISILTASQKVHLRRCASSFPRLREGRLAAYFYVRLIPQDSRALHLELFTVPSTLATFYEVVNMDVKGN